MRIRRAPLMLALVVLASSCSSLRIKMTANRCAEHLSACESSPGEVVCGPTMVPGEVVPGVPGQVIGPFECCRCPRK